MRIEGDYVFVTEEELNKWEDNGVIVKNPYGENIMSCGLYDSLNTSERNIAQKGAGFTSNQRDSVQKNKTNPMHFNKFQSDSINDDLKGVDLHPYMYTGYEFEIDHIIPKAQGGSNSISNAQLVSRRFNQSKKNTIDYAHIKKVKVDEG